MCATAWYASSRMHTLRSLSSFSPSAGVSQASRSSLGLPLLLLICKKSSFVIKPTETVSFFLVGGKLSKGDGREAKDSSCLCPKKTCVAFTKVEVIYRLREQVTTSAGMAVLCSFVTAQVENCFGSEKNKNKNRSHLIKICVPMGKQSASESYNSTVAVKHTQREPSAFIFPVNKRHRLTSSKQLLSSVAYRGCPHTHSRQHVLELALKNHRLVLREQQTHASLSEEFLTLKSPHITNPTLSSRERL